MKNTRGGLSPAAMQGLIWAAAIVVCIAFAVSIHAVTGRRGAAAPEPAEAAASVDTPSQPAPGGLTPAQPPAMGPGPAAPYPPVAAGGPPVSAPGARQELTEDLFVELSALMLIASASFDESEAGQMAFEQVCEDIVTQHGVAPDEFRRMSEEIGRDPARSEEIRNRVFERVSQLSLPEDAHVRTGTGPSVRPRRPPEVPRPGGVSPPP